MMIRLMLILCTLSFMMHPVYAQDGRSIASDVFVNPGKTTMGRLKNVPDNVTVSLGVSSDQQIWVYLLDETSIKDFPKVKKPILMAQVQDRLQVNMKLLKGGNYYIAFHNQSQTTGVKVNFFARVQASMDE